MNALANEKTLSSLAWVLTQGRARNPGHHVGFGKFRDQKMLVMRTTLYSFEHRMVISSITYCRSSFHVEPKDFLP